MRRNNWFKPSLTLISACPAEICFIRVSELKETGRIFLFLLFPVELYHGEGLTDKAGSKRQAGRQARLARQGKARQGKARQRGKAGQAVDNQNKSGAEDCWV